MNMARAGREVVPATLQDDADIERWKRDEDVTIRLIRAMIAACAAEPALNARFDSESLSLCNRNASILVWRSTARMVCSFRCCAMWPGRVETYGGRQIDAAKRGVAERSLKPAELRDPTITLSNFGTIAGKHAALVIVPPQVAIVGAGRIRDVAVRGDGGPVMHRMLPLSLTFDHRAVTGGEAARFLRAFIADLEKPH